VAGAEATDVGGLTEYVMFTLRESLEAVKAFAGAGSKRAANVRKPLRSAMPCRIAKRPANPHE
jgi:hypothetical protein